MLEKLEKVILDNNIGFQLSESAKEFLPDNLRENNLSNWILEFDSLKDWGKEEGTSSFLPNNKKNANRLTKLRNLLTFYFNTLFFIGRMQKVSNDIIGQVNEALEEKNLEKSISHNREFFSINKIKTDIEIKKELIAFLNESYEVYNFSYNLSIEWWDIWEKEVSVLKSYLDDFSGDSLFEHLNNYHCFNRIQSSYLFYDLEKNGIIARKFYTEIYKQKKLKDKQIYENVIFEIPLKQVKLNSCFDDDIWHEYISKMNMDYDRYTNELFGKIEDIISNNYSVAFNIVCNIVAGSIIFNEEAKNHIIRQFDEFNFRDKVTFLYLLIRMHYGQISSKDIESYKFLIKFLE